MSADTEPPEDLARRAGLVLDAASLADLAISVAVVTQLVAMLPRDRPFADEPATIPSLPRAAQRPPS